MMEKIIVDAFGVMTRKKKLARGIFKGEVTPTPIIHVERERVAGYLKEFDPYYGQCKGGRVVPVRVTVEVMPNQ